LSALTNASARNALVHSNLSILISNQNTSVTEAWPGRGLLLRYTWLQWHDWHHPCCLLQQVRQQPGTLSPASSHGCT